MYKETNNVMKMLMKTKMKSALGARVGVLVVCAALLAGCDGGSSTTATTGPSNTVRGATTQGAATASTPITVPTAGGASQTVTVGGVSETAVVPSGAATNVAAGSPLAVVQSGSTLLAGSFAANAPLSVNGVSNSGVTTNADGSVVQNIALPIDAVNGTDYAFALPQGNVQTRALAAATARTRALTVHATTFSGRFYSRGGVTISPLPTGVTGKIPNNGENASGSQVTATFGAGNDGRTARLTVNYGNGFVLDQTQTIKGGLVTFQNFATDASNVPISGVASLALAVGPL